METRKKRAAQLHSQSEAPQVPTGNQEEDQGKVSSPQCALDPGRSFFHDKTNSSNDLQQSDGKYAHNNQKSKTVESSNRVHRKQINITYHVHTVDIV